MMKTNTNPGIRAIYNRMTPASFVERESIARDMMREDPNIAYFGVGHTFTRDNDIAVLDLLDAPKGSSAVAFPPDSEFKQLINHHLIKLRMSGVLDKLWRKWFSSLDKEGGGLAGMCKEANLFFTLGYNNVLFPMCVLGMGVLWSGAAFCLEHCVKKFKQPEPTQRPRTKLRRKSIIRNVRPVFKTRHVRMRSATSSTSIKLRRLK